MKSLLAGSAVASLLAAGLVVAPAQAAIVSCGTGISYDSTESIETTNYGVNDVVAKGTSCTAAVAIALASKSTGPTYRYTARKFKCHGTTDAQGGSTAYRAYVCKRKVGSKVKRVTFSSIGN